MSGDRHIAVVGGGIAGLAAAHAAIEAGAESRCSRPTDRLGGMILTTPFAGRPAIDEGADAFLARVPWAVDLARKVSLADSLTSPRGRQGGGVVESVARHPRRSAARSADRHRARWPASRLLSLARQAARRARTAAAREPIAAPDSIGKYVRSRFGDEVHERLVDPLVGSIYAADTDDFSLAAVPQFAELRRAVAQRAARPPTASTAISRRDRLLRATCAASAHSSMPSPTRRRRGAATFAATAPVAELAADGDGWRVDGEPFDAVMLACPARSRPRCSRHDRPDGRGDPGRDPTADVALVTLAVAGGRLAGPPAERCGLPRAEAAAAPGHRRVVRIAEVGALAHARTTRSCASRWDATGSAALHLSDDELLADVVDELQRATSESTCNRRPCASAAGPTRSRSTGRITGTWLPLPSDACPPASPSPAPATTASASPRACTRGARRRLHCCSAESAGRMCHAA